MATITGSSGNDSFTSDTGADLIYGGGGNDTLSDLGGNDTIHGGDGNDQITDGNDAGSDLVFGGNGNDSSFGGTGTGNDSLYGDAGNDSLVAGQGNDLIHGGSENDTLAGNGGADTVHGDSGNDLVFGGAGNDQVFLGTGSDRFGDGLADDSGDDTIDAGSGADSVQAGAGNDLIQSGGTAPIGTTLIENGTFSSGYASWTGWMQEVGAESAYLSNGSSNLVAEMDAAPGSITTMEQSFTVSGPSSASLTLRAATRLAGQVGQDGFTVNILDGQGNVVASTTVIPGSNDWANYTLAINFPAAGTYRLQLVELGNDDGGGTIVDDIQITTTTAMVDVMADQLQGGAGNDTIQAGAGNDTLAGEADDDRLYGGAGNDLVQGGTGNDSLEGGTGDDTLSGGDGNDTVLAGAGNDSLTGDAGTDLLSYAAETAGVGVDLTTGATSGAAAGDTISGFENLEGGAGNDTLTGTGGANQVFGGAGNDTILFGAGNDTVYGGTGADYVDDAATVQKTGQDLAYGGAGNDTIYTGLDADTVYGGADDDLIQGEDGNDLLWGDTGNDKLDGGAGNDTLWGGAGNDSLTSGSGADFVGLSAAGGTDRVSDFDLTRQGALTTDQLDVSELTGVGGGPVRARDVVVTDDGFGNAVLTFPGGERLVLEGIAPATVNSTPALHAMGVPCFAEGALIDTPQGPRPVEEIRPGDLVLTRAGLRPVLWHGVRRLDAGALRLRPDLRPVRLRAGHYGLTCDLVLSPQHGVVVGAALVRARHLARWGQGARVMAVGQVTYHHLLLPEHAILTAQGAAVESLFPGPEALRCLLAPDRAALCAILGGVYGPRALPLLPGKAAAALLRPGALARPGRPVAVDAG